MNQDSVSEIQSEQSNLSRRDFIKYSAVLSAAFIAWWHGLRPASAAPGNETSNSVEKDKVFESIGILDFAPEKETEGVRQLAYPNNDQLARAILGDKYMSQEQLRAELVQSGGEWEPIYDQFPEVASVYQLMSRFQNHGESVAKAINETGKFIARGGKPSITPIQKYLGPENIAFEPDIWGNIGISLNVTSGNILNGVGQILKDFPQAKVVNLSIPVGKIHAYHSKGEVKIDEPSVISIGTNKGDTVHFLLPAGSNGHEVRDEDGRVTKFILDDGTELNPLPEDKVTETRDNLADEEAKKIKESGQNPGTRTVDAYVKESAVENIGKLLELAKKLSEKKLFLVAAAGNFDDDLRSMQTHLAQQKYLLTVAEWEQKTPVNRVHGAEIYVPNQEFSFGHGSSLSTPIVSDLVASFLDEGIPEEQIKQAVLELCDKVKYQAVDSDDFSVREEEVYVLNLKKVILHFNPPKPPRKRELTRREFLTGKFDRSEE